MSDHEDDELARTCSQRAWAQEEQRERKKQTAPKILMPAEALAETLAWKIADIVDAVDGEIELDHVKAAAREVLLEHLRGVAHKS